MTEISFKDFQKWLSKYRMAWQKGDPQAIMNLFSEGARYYENPFADPMTGIKTIQKYWSEGAEQSQKDVRFRYKIIATVQSSGLARWQADFIRLPSGNKVELDGFLLAEFDENAKCTTFREWWHRRENNSIEAC